MILMIFSSQLLKLQESNAKLIQHVKKYVKENIKYDKNWEIIVKDVNKLCRKVNQNLFDLALQHKYCAPKKLGKRVLKQNIRTVK